MAVLYMRFLWRVAHHKWWVFRYGIKVGGIPLWRLVIHDWTKLTRAEFMPRFRYQILDELCNECPTWKACVNAHHARNLHHWQHWVDGGKPHPMPEAYVREMVADWMAAQKTYGGTVDRWLKTEYSKMRLHPQTVQILERVLRSQGIKVPVHAALA